MSTLYHAGKKIEKARKKKVGKHMFERLKKQGKKKSSRKK